jgi:hypothetical protein
MILELPCVTIPLPLATLLKTHMHSGVGSVAQIFDLTSADKSFELLAKQSLSDVVIGHENMAFDKILLAVGWRSFRERIVLRYLESYQQTYKIDEEIVVDDLLDFESRYVDFSQTSLSRLLMLAFFFKVCELHEIAHGNIKHGNLLVMPYYVDEILAQGKAKNEKIDWMILLIWQLGLALGEDKLKKIFQTSKGNVQAIWQELAKLDQEKILKNMLVYAAAIHEDTLFTQQFTEA